MRKLDWQQILAMCLRAHKINVMAYVPDHVIGRLITEVQKDPLVTLVSATREEEAMGIVSGAYLGGMRSALLMQNSGLGNSINALTSFVIPYRIPFPMVISMRGDLGEFNLAQVAGGRITRPVLDTLGIQHFTIAHTDDMAQVVDGVLKLCYAGHQPVAILLSSTLTGGKNG